MQLCASWRHRRHVAHAHWPLTGLAVFPARLFPAGAMAEVKACVFYGSKSHIVPPFNEPSPPACHRGGFRPNYSGPVVERAAKWRHGCSFSRWCSSLGGWTRCQLVSLKFDFTMKWNEMNVLFCNVPVVAALLTSAAFAFVEDLDDT